MKRTQCSDENEQPLRVRRPLAEMSPVCEPRVELTRTQLQRRCAKASRHNCMDSDPLAAIGLQAMRTKEQIDAFEQLLHAGMPPRVVLDNTFAGLRNSCASDLQTAMEVQWKRGVKHAETILSDRIALQKTMAPSMWHDEPCVHAVPLPDAVLLPDAVPPEVLPAAEEPLPDLVADLAKFLEDVPPSSNSLDIETQLDLIDLDALALELNSITQMTEMTA